MRIDLFSGIDESIIHKSMSNIKEHLSDVAMHSCNKHAFQEHSDKSDAYLQRRMLTEHKHSVTSFYSKDDAIRASVITLEKCWHEVENFLMTGEPRHAITYDLGETESVGYGYIYGIFGVFEDCHKVIVVLDKDTDAPWGFRIHTVYPIITKDLTPDTTIGVMEEV